MGEVEIQFRKTDADEVRAVRAGHGLEERGKRAVQRRFEFDVFDRTLLNDEIRHYAEDVNSWNGFDSQGFDIAAEGQNIND
jgi:hypothetical protein